MIFTNILDSAMKMILGLINKGEKEMIIITHPNKLKKVGLRHTIRGRARPAGQPITVLVFSRDGKWYFQKEATWKGKVWHVECQFGLEDTPLNSAYEIVAIAGKPSPEPLKEIPKGVTHSNQRCVIRGYK